jgi:hypothetical protein
VYKANNAHEAAQFFFAFIQTHEMASLEDQIKQLVAAVAGAQAVTLAHGMSLIVRYWVGIV